MRVRIVVAGLLLFSLSGSVFALIGPPTAELEKGQWSDGFNYSYSSDDLGKETIKYTYQDFDSTGVEIDSGSGRYSLEVKDFEMDRYYGRVGYGLLDSLEVYGQAGATKIKAKEREVGDTEWFGYESDTDFAWGLGAKYTFLRQEKIDWGATAQLNWFGFDDSEKYTDTFDIGEGVTETDIGKEDTNIDLMDLFVAVGPTVDMGGWKLFGGALYKLITADYDYKDHGSYTDTDENSGTYTEKDSGDYHKDSFGGYLGAEFNVYKNSVVQVEGLGTNNSWGLSAGIEVRF